MFDKEEAKEEILWKKKKNKQANEQTDNLDYKKLIHYIIKQEHAIVVKDYKHMIMLDTYQVDATAIKYITRHRDKGGAIDIKKAIWFLKRY